MRRAHQARDHAIGEDVRAPELRHVIVEPIDVREAAAEHDDVRIEHVDDARERARHALLVPRERSIGERVHRRRA